jgi:uncharacterized membrane protein YuzA (DUF378 family)
MKYLKQIAYVLLLIGGINWGIYGVSGYDVVEVLFGQIPMIANLVYVLVGLSSFYIILSRLTLCGCNKTCACSCADSKCDCSCDCPCSEKPVSSDAPAASSVESTKTPTTEEKN